jgi:hypothetical protein
VSSIATLHIDIMIAQMNFHFYFYSSFHNYNRKSVFSMWIKEGFHIEIEGIEDGFLGL